MAVKKVEVADIGTVALYKRRGVRNVRLSISHDGQVRVTMPSWAPYKVGLDFLQARREWIASQRSTPDQLTEGYTIGTSHQLRFVSSTNGKLTTRLSGNEVRVLLPITLHWDSPSAQKAARAAGIRALKKEANELLPPRLRFLAQKHGYEYHTVTVKQLKGRWGSCSEKKDIVLNCFLMQLPPELVDYVLLHELAHTRIMAHGPAFWQEIDRALPESKQFRKLIKSHKPVL